VIVKGGDITHGNSSGPPFLPVAADLNTPDFDTWPPLLRSGSALELALFAHVKAEPLTCALRRHEALPPWR
jgi:hypothetical protein